MPLTKSAALEYAAKGIRINAVCRGSVHTPMVERALADEPETMKAVMKEIPLGCLGRPEKIAAAILWLCSPAASFVIGHALLSTAGTRHDKDEPLQIEGQNTMKAITGEAPLIALNNGIRMPALGHAGSRRARSRGKCRRVCDRRRLPPDRYRGLLSKRAPGR
jgi:hypothetical protein